VIRTIGEIRRAFTYNSAKALAIRGTADQLALADWLVAQLNRPESQPLAASAEYRLPAADDGADTVRIFSLITIPSVEEVQQRARQIRTETGLKRAFMYTPNRDLVVRGTSDQVAHAERVVSESGAR
jgi:hypothetical protein